MYKGRSTKYKGKKSCVSCGSRDSCDSRDRDRMSQCRKKIQWKTEKEIQFQVTRFRLQERPLITPEAHLGKACRNMINPHQVRDDTPSLFPFPVVRFPLYVVRKYFPPEADLGKVRRNLIQFQVTRINIQEIKNKFPHVKRKKKT